ncbi:hypothetical protein LTR56_001570 [Elasticomyces elasticus]|nr:hypothetical protein LTR56_001570 [Elasticomyces elasticus]KAK3667378.1 hypothetical protein LTR22_001894 [Elasticomyces elasticus]KAK4932542.1 hypothetical protein LTR49_000966 [Elasticomyces elasticus]KAK5769564.1 hypothetical protein LTS12_000014 [Elasticomyces elasticus]
MQHQHLHQHRQQLNIPGFSEQPTQTSTATPTSTFDPSSASTPSPSPTSRPSGDDGQAWSWQYFLIVICCTVFVVLLMCFACATWHNIANWWRRQRVSFRRWRQGTGQVQTAQGIALPPIAPVSAAPAPAVQDPPAGPAPALPLPAPEPPAYSAASANPAGLSYGLIQPPPNPSPTPSQMTNHDQEFQAAVGTDSSSSVAHSSEDSQQTRAAGDDLTRHDVVGEQSSESEVDRTSLERQELRSNVQE